MDSHFTISIAIVLGEIAGEEKIKNTYDLKVRGESPQWMPFIIADAVILYAAGDRQLNENCSIRLCWVSAGLL